MSHSNPSQKIYYILFKHFVNAIKVKKSKFFIFLKEIKMKYFHQSTFNRYILNGK